MHYDELEEIESGVWARIRADRRRAALKDHPHILALIIRAEEACVRFGVSLSALPYYSIWQDNKGGDHPASYLSSCGRVQVDVGNAIWVDCKTAMLREGPNGTRFNSSEREDYPFLHEIGHHLHRDGLIRRWREKIPPPPNFQEIAREVSTYAATNPEDFLAETFAALVDGRELSREVLDMYDALDGWRPDTKSEGGGKSHTVTA